MVAAHRVLMTSTSPTSSNPNVGTYLVERYWPGITQELLAAAIARGELEASGPTQVGGRVRRLGSVLLASDEVVFCLFRARSRDDVVRANVGATFPFDRITEATCLPSLQPPITPVLGTQEDPHV